MSDKPYDFILFGASSFVGSIMSRYLLDNPEIAENTRWAMAGRNLDKLREVIKGSSASGEVDLIQADANDETSLRELCQKTAVIVSTVGPFARYGEALVRACVETGTDYCDITGEVHWMLQMISRYQAKAAETGARIVHCCGFDSIPSDMGVYFTQEAAKARFGQTCDEINMRVMRLKGSFSGGTFASLLNAVTDIQANPNLRKTLASPYCICPSDHPYKTRQKRHKWAEFDENVSQQWIAPFVMEGVNTRVVHRSNALFDHAYGEHFAYDEAVATGEGRKGRKRASRTAMGLAGLMVAAGIGPLRSILKRFLPKPGEGPSHEEQESGGYTLRFFGKVRGKGTLICDVEGKRDPGYGSTARILTQAALCLAKDISKRDVPGGFWTPASIFKQRIIERTQAHAGLSFSEFESK